MEGDEGRGRFCAQVRLVEDASERDENHREEGDDVPCLAIRGEEQERDESERVACAAVEDVLC